MPGDASAAKQELKTRLKHLLQTVDGCLVTRHQKLKLGICPRLNWLLTIYKYPTNLDRELDSMTTRFLKKWAGLAKSANTSLLYLPQCDGGLNLPSPSSLYQRLQVSRQCQLLTSADPTVRFIAEENLKSEMASKRKKFRPTMVVQEAMKDDPSRTRRALQIASMRKVKMDEDESRLGNLKGLPRQGQMMRIATPEAASTWAKSIQSLAQHVFKFALNATHDVLPHNANLHLWKKCSSSSCPLCHQPGQNLIHVLNNCKVALDLRRYDDRHNRVLQAMANTIQDHLPSSPSMTGSVQWLFIPNPHCYRPQTRHCVVE